MAAGLRLAGSPNKLTVPSDRDASEWIRPSTFGWMSRLTNDVPAAGAAPSVASVADPRFAPSLDCRVTVESEDCCWRELPQAWPSFWLKPMTGHSFDGMPASAVLVVDPVSPELGVSVRMLPLPLAACCPPKPFALRLL